MNRTQPLSNIRVIIADDHPLFRKGLAGLIKSIPFIKHVDEAADGNEVLHLLSKGHYDLVFLDINMPGMDGRTAATHIRKQFPDVFMIAISMIDDSFTISQMYLSGCHGYLIKNSEEKEILKALTTVLNGKKYFAPEIIEKLSIDPDERDSEKFLNKFNLTPSSIRMIQLICAGKSNKEIADEFGSSIRTVENRRLSIYRKAGVSNTAALIRFAKENDFIKD